MDENEKIINSLLKKSTIRYSTYLERAQEEALQNRWKDFPLHRFELCTYDNPESGVWLNCRLYRIGLTLLLQMGVVSHYEDILDFPCLSDTNTPHKIIDYFLKIQFTHLHYGLQKSADDFFNLIRATFSNSNKGLNLNANKDYLYMSVSKEKQFDVFLNLIDLMAPIFKSFVFVPQLEGYNLNVIVDNIKDATFILDYENAYFYQSFLPYLRKNVEKGRWLNINSSNFDVYNIGIASGLYLLFDNPTVEINFEAATWFENPDAERDIKIERGIRIEYSFKDDKYEPLVRNFINKIEKTLNPELNRHFTHGKTHMYCPFPKNELLNIFVRMIDIVVPLLNEFKSGGWHNNGTRSEFMIRE